MAQCYNCQGSIPYGAYMFRKFTRLLPNLLRGDLLEVVACPHCQKDNCQTIISSICYLLGMAICVLGILLLPVVFPWLNTSFVWLALFVVAAFLYDYLWWKFVIVLRAPRSLFF